MNDIKKDPWKPKVRIIHRLVAYHFLNFHGLPCSSYIVWERIYLFLYKSIYVCIKEVCAYV